jgi:hypothetical protein
MDPIILRRLLDPLRVSTVTLAIAVLSAGAGGLAAAAPPTFVRPSSAPAGDPIVPPAVLAVAPGLLAEAAIDPSLVALLVPPAEDELGPDAVRIAAPAAKPATTPAVKPAKPARAAAPSREHRGRNHVWSAGLGLDRNVTWFSCSRSRQPDYLVYRWGCAGRKNVYLFAHAGGPFRRLHDLYVQGRLHKGMTVTYADGDGHVHRYSVAWWRVVLPTAGEFAYAGQSRPSMTLQTCVGPHDRYRLVVRLYQSD